MSNATDVVLAGDSAGGMGVWLNLRFVKEQFRASTTVAGAPIAVSLLRIVLKRLLPTLSGHAGVLLFCAPVHWAGSNKVVLGKFRKERVAGSH